MFGSDFFRDRDPAGAEIEPDNMIRSQRPVQPDTQIGLKYRNEKTRASTFGELTNMKSIKKMTKAVAGSALLVGATLAGGAAMGAAQRGSSGMTLGDYPAPFVDDDGEVDATVVVGESAQTIDVVGGINVAGSLGNAAFSEEQVSASGGSFGWSATNGVSLDTRNDALYFGDNLDEVRETLTQDDLMTLEETSFEDDSGEDGTDWSLITIIVAVIAIGGVLFYYR